MNKYDYYCKKGCKRESGSDGDERTRMNKENNNIITYNCNICGEVTIFAE